MGEIDGVTVASAFRTAVGTGIFFGSYYYVKKEYRKRGFGTRLRDQVARDHVGNNILVVDATDDSKTANEAKFGYIKAPFQIVRLSGPSRIEVKTENITFETITKKHFDDIIDYDNNCYIQANYPIRRAFLLKWLFDIEGSRSVVAFAKGKIVGYGQRRPTEGCVMHFIGPLYADSDEIAMGILSELGKGLPEGNKFYLHAYSANKSWMKLLNEKSYETVFSAQRMYLNGNPKDYKPNVYSTTSLGVLSF
ncbi:DgyrCDS14102 [Dimorphilus gyrociliatus]|nr:DgyrCDS14102 [Dimorphilus gyrociliatus]